MNSDTIIERLKKIHALATQGYKGEADNAKILLDKLLKNHNLTLDDIKDEKVTKRTFKYTYAREKQIILQCISKVKDEPELKYSYKKDKRKEFFVDVTDWQYKEAMDLIEFHVKQYREEVEKKMDAFLRAYINRHDLFAESAEASSDSPTLTPAEYSEFLKAYDALEDSNTYHKKITV